MGRRGQCRDGRSKPRKEGRERIDREKGRKKKRRYLNVKNQSYFPELQTVTFWNESKEGGLFTLSKENWSPSERRDFPKIITHGPQESKTVNRRSIRPCFLPPSEDVGLKDSLVGRQFNFVGVVEEVTQWNPKEQLNTRSWQFYQTRCLGFLPLPSTVS